MLRIIIITLAVLEGGWLAFDGALAPLRGDYVTPKSGQHAGRLGPWKHVVSAVGIEPRSALMMWIHVVIGVAWLVVIVLFALELQCAWWGMLIAAIAGLWYLPFGTLLSVVQIVLLIIARSRMT